MIDPGTELVDVVDDDGHPIARVTRREMRARRLPHRCVYLLVFDAAGRIFVHQRTATKDVFPSRWDMTIGGVLAAGEDFETGARRELEEELGQPAPDGDPFELGEVRQAGGKRVVAWGLEADLDVSAIESDTFEIEWPPRSGRMREFPEVDRAEWCDLATARRRLNPAQARLLDALVRAAG